MTDLTGADGWLAERIAGSTAGAAVSLVYLFPGSHREAATRFLTGVCCGLVFGGPAGLWLEETLGLGDRLSGPELVLSGSALASLVAWWGLGILARIAASKARMPGGPAPTGSAGGPGKARTGGDADGEARP